MGRRRAIMLGLAVALAAGVTARPAPATPIVRLPATTRLAIAAAVAGPDLPRTVHPSTARPPGAAARIVLAAATSRRVVALPGGCYDRAALDLVHAAGLTPVEWNVNSIDAFNSYPQQIALVVLSQVRPGSIVVMHLQGGVNAPATGLALRLIIPALVRRGYQMDTVSQLLAAGPAVQPSDPREVVEYYQPPPTPAPTPLVAARIVTPAPRWCGWVKSPRGWSYVCR
jgi:hypothetical protein